MNARLISVAPTTHSARPWWAENAIAAAVRGLEPLVGIEPVDVEVDGLVFREVLTVTTIHGGIATNVVPDRVEANLNYRYAPTRTAAEGEARGRELGGGGQGLSNSPPAPGGAGAPGAARPPQGR